MGEWEESWAGFPEHSSVCSVGHRRTTCFALCFPGRRSSRLDLAPVRRLLAPGLGCVCCLGVGLWCLAPAVPGGLSERGKGVLLQGFCQSITPRCLWVCWGWFYESSSAFTTCCWLWEARSSGQGEMGTVAAASTDSGVGLMCNHSHPLHPLLSPWGWAPGLPCHEQTLSKERLFYRGFTHSE